MSIVHIATLDGGLATQKARDIFTAIQQWPHWSEIARGAEKEYGMTREEFEQLLPEYQRFIALCAAFPGMGMLGERVDILWHSHILNTRRYQEFNEQYIGHMIHHLPCSSFELYGVGRAQAPICEDPPETCYDPLPAPPDPSPLPEEEVVKKTHESILNAAPRFVAAYTETFGCSPSLEYWPRVALVDAVAQ